MKNSKFSFPYYVLPIYAFFVFCSCKAEMPQKQLPVIGVPVKDEAVSDSIDYKPVELLQDDKTRSVHGI
ncbi:MAG TPA: hypothetical protein ENJ95_12385 [Bacteroidetes bacterium]|nr:hypothetical protein [Bacteroidota bacterium]